MKTKLGTISDELRQVTNQLESESLDNPSLVEKLKSLNEKIMDYEDITNPSTQIDDRCTRRACER